jgi:hypothetical protein
MKRIDAELFAVPDQGCAFGQKFLVCTTAEPRPKLFGLSDRKPSRAELVRKVLGSDFGSAPEYLFG